MEPNVGPGNGVSMDTVSQCLKGGLQKMDWGTIQELEVGVNGHHGENVLELVELELNLELASVTIQDQLMEVTLVLAKGKNLDFVA